MDLLLSVTIKQNILYFPFKEAHWYVNQELEVIRKFYSL